MSSHLRSAMRNGAAFTWRRGARQFSARASLQQEIRDAYILSASRTPTAKVRHSPEYLFGSMVGLTFYGSSMARSSPSPQPGLVLSLSSLP